jgi:photosystem II stability/assembly factor-like uncharacterized protein
MKSFLTFVILILLINSCNNLPSTTPKAMGDDEEENLRNRSLWFENMHRAAPGTDWKNIEANNKINALAIKNEKKQYANRVNETFAGGLLSGTWEEKGPNNNSGRAVVSDFDTPTNTIYTVTAGGSLWKGGVAGNSWTLLNDDIQFDTRVIKVFNKSTGGRRIMIGYQEQLYWSDDEGATITKSIGLNPIGWGGNYMAKVIVLNDANQTMYALAYAWDGTLGWAPRHTLYMSTDKGVSFSLVKVFNSGVDREVSLNNPYNSNLVFVTDVSNITANRISLYEVVGATATLIPSGTAIINGGKSPLAGNVIGDNVNLYLLLNNNALFKRTKTISTGVWADWTFVANTTVFSNNVLDISPSSTNIVLYGGVDAYRSTNGGATSAIVNSWLDYYPDPLNKLHADMFEIKHYKKSDNTIFELVNCDGGIYYSTDDVATVTNLTMSGFNNSQSYDIITDTLTPSIVYNGAQDQGIQRISTINAIGLQNSTQFLSGDYGYLALTNNNTRLWAMYPRTVHYFTNPITASTSSASWSSAYVPGTNVANFGWMLPMKASANATNNFVYVGGGNVSGAGGSFLIKLAATINPPIVYTPTQFAYDFRANSNSGTSCISALEVSLRDANKLYVATEDGTFFYSNDNGTSWTRSTTFSGLTGWYLYGQTIVASKLTSGLVWYGGSGYSNPAIYKSTDGGITFTAMNNGLPPTLIHEIVANTDETMLFAATDAGPYVYIVATNQWYPMIGAATPLQMYMAVEYIRASNIVRFSTHGRGIFDFKINTGVLPITGLELQAALLSNKTVQINFSTETEIDNDYFEIEKSSTGNANFSSIGLVHANGNGNSTSKQTYSFIDKTPFTENNFYRIKQVDKNGKISYSNIVKINYKKGIEITLAPNPAQQYFSLSPYTDVKQVKLFDANGKLITVFNASKQYDVSKLTAGIYFVHILTQKGEEQRISFVKD